MSPKILSALLLAVLTFLIAVQARKTYRLNPHQRPAPPRKRTQSCFDTTPAMHIVVVEEEKPEPVVKNITQGKIPLPCQSACDASCDAEKEICTAPCPIKPERETCSADQCIQPVECQEGEDGYNCRRNETSRVKIIAQQTIHIQAKTTTTTNNQQNINGDTVDANSQKLP